MKKKRNKVLLTATLVSTAMTMGGCGDFFPWSNQNASVYGPPPEEFSVEENRNAGVYGPPPDEEVTVTPAIEENREITEEEE